ncbi:hypothetical protein BDY21DRAFT_292685 [Lineolata rhizophorae]|uniref:tyrosinase n=1 Tax=Lineolata rhizophorae TaxID=578093 RepID=A0A6A6NPE1_9PEZI|nr:hypothetical protein BDY21DRAFT_292685 [Lineolata rhizophorae]
MLVFTTHSSGLIGLIWIFLFFQNAFSIHPVTGRTGHGVHPRLEIRELAKDRDQFNLYLLGLQRFQAMDQNDMLSYYQIAGIHGRPYKEYDGVPGVHSSGGYCPHVSNMFMPWHRPFLALFEEALLRKVDEIVDQFPAGATRNRYRSAADKLRVPFWDWAMNAPQGENVVPRQLTDEFVSVTSPNGDQTISNPLYSYKFNPLNTNDMGGYPYTVWQNTLRRPTSRDGNAKSNTQQFVSMMDSNQKSLHDRMYGLFTRAAPFVEVSTECVGNGCGNDVSHDSFESVHDVIHIISGGNTGGHMYLLDFSAFDPVFWLHHANVDRAMALFNFLYPDTYVEPGRQTQDNFQWSRGQVKNAWTPLKPFHSNSNGDFWMAKDIKDPSVFGYTYPELTNGATTSSVRSAINRLYQPQSSSSSRRRSLFPGNSTVSVYTNGTGSDREYMLNVVGEKFALGGSYAIYFFLGECDLEDMSSWGDCPGFVGANGVLAPSGGVTMNGTTVTGLVPITSALHDLHLGGYLDSLDEDVVEAFLSLRLHWVVVKVRSNSGTSCQKSLSNTIEGGRRNPHRRSCPGT